MASVSTVIPTHNRPGRVLEAIKSVREQTLPVDELLLVNDGSSIDYSSVREELDAFGSKTVTKFLETDGEGAAKARNVGASESSGDILMFLDDDDRWHSTKVERQMALLNDSHGLVYSGRLAVGDNGSPLYTIDGDAMGDLKDEILTTNRIGTTSSVAVNTDLFESISGFDVEMPALQDWELWIRLCQHTAVIYDPEHTVEWTIHSNGSQMADDHRLYAKAVARIEEKHNLLFNRLSWRDRRRARAYRHQVVASKRPETSPRRYLDLSQSLVNWPTLSAAAAFLPDTVVQRLRT